MSNSGQVKIGVFIPKQVQMLDFATCDILYMMSHEYLVQLESLVPRHVADLAPSIAIYYIGAGGAKTQQLSADATIAITHDFTDPAVAPGQLDIILVPGPDPRLATKDYPAEARFLRAHFENPGTDVLSVCTGIYWCGAAGILDGRQSSGPRGLQDDLKKKFPKVKLVGDNHRWTRDGNFWSSGEFHYPGPEVYLSVRYEEADDSS